MNKYSPKELIQISRKNKARSKIMSSGGRPEKQQVCELYYEGIKVPGIAPGITKVLLEAKWGLYMHEKEKYRDLLKFEIVPQGAMPKQARI